MLVRSRNNVFTALGTASFLCNSRLVSPTPDMVIVWKRPDGTSCVLARGDDGRLVLKLQAGTTVRQQQAVDSTREAMELAKRWEELAHPK